jgi:hypothetical protein
MKDIDKRIASAKKQAVHHRNYRRARDRALVQLAQKHSVEYKALLEKEKASDKIQGKKWLDINGNTELTLGIKTHTSITGTNGTGYDGENQGNNGGEG